MNFFCVRPLAAPAFCAGVILTLAVGCGDDGDDATGAGGAPTSSGIGPATSSSTASATSSGTASATSSNTTSTTTSASSSMSATTGSGMCMPVGMETCADVADEDCDGTECALWGHVYDLSDSQGHASEIVVDPNGDIYMIGQVGNAGATIDLNGTTATATATERSFLTKISAQGNTLWTKMLPGQGGPQEANFYRLVGATDSSVIVDAFLIQPADFGGGLLQPSGWYDHAYVSFDGDGSYQWATQFVTPGDGVFGGLSDLSPLNEVVIVGYAAAGSAYDGTTIINPASPASRNWFGLAFDATTGNIVWQEEGWVVGDLENNNTYQAMAFGHQGDIYITGSVHSDLAFGGPTMAFTNDWASAFVAHLDADGQWVDGGMFSDNCYPEDLTIGPNGEVVLSAWVSFYEFAGAPTPSEPNRWAVFALDDQYQPTWVHFMSEVPTLATAPDGDIAFVLGDNNDIAVHAPATFPAKGTIDIVTGRIGLDGTMKWYRQFGAPGGLVDDHSPWKTFGVQPDGKAIVAFRSAGQPVDFGSGPLAPTGTDLGLVQLAP
jgi:hypothetical protein